MLSFFNDPATTDELASLADARRLTVYAGAGTSAEIGLPSWETLVGSLLDDAIEHAGWANDAAAFRAASTSGSLLATAEMISALLGGDITNSIRAHLYQGLDPADLRPGPLARAIASLQAAFGRSMQLVTTNYDPVLEAALRLHARGDRWWSDVRTYVRTRQPLRDSVPVTHLHGFLGNNENRGKIVLTEGDYQRMQLQTRWQEQWMGDALDETTCLFLGASMTDANLVRYLHRSAGRRDDHVVIFRRADASTADQLRFRNRYEEALRIRWRQLGVRALFADNYADVAQFVRELAAMRRDRTWTPFADRLQDWWRAESEQGCLYAADEAVYQQIQGILHDGLRTAATLVKETLTADNALAAEEQLGLSLFAVYPPGDNSEERVVNVASSDRIMTDPASVAPIRLSGASDWTSVTALCNGTPLREPKDVYASRWRYVLAAPVFNEERQLLLGSVTLSSMTPNSVLSSLPEGTHDAVVEHLVTIADELLTIADAG